MTARVRIEFEWPRHNVLRVGRTVYFGLERAGAVHVIGSTCAHRGGPLHLGRIENGGQVERLRCPWHGNTFRIDRLCARGMPAVRTGSRVVAYLPAAGADDVPVATSQLVLVT